MLTPGTRNGSKRYGPADVQIIEAVEPHARVRLLGGARLHRLRHADLQAPPRAARERGGRGDDGARRGRDGHRARRPSCSSARSSRCATWSPRCARSCWSRSCRRAARRSRHVSDLDRSAKQIEATATSCSRCTRWWSRRAAPSRREPPATRTTSSRAWWGKTAVFVASLGRRSRRLVLPAAELRRPWRRTSATPATWCIATSAGRGSAGAGRALDRRGAALGFDALMFNLVFESNPARRLYERPRVRGGRPRAGGGRRRGRARLLAPASDPANVHAYSGSSSTSACARSPVRAPSRCHASDTCGASSKRDASEWSPRYASANRPIVTP